MSGAPVHPEKPDSGGPAQFLGLLRWKNKFVLLAWSLALLLFVSGAFAQAVPGSVDTTFAPSSVEGNINGGYSAVTAIVIQPDGKILVGGNFAVFDGVYADLIRLNPDGSADPSFSPAFAGQLYSGASLALQSDGKIIVCDSTSGVNRVNADGSLDPAFNTGGSLASTVAIQSDGKILVGGLFTSFNGVAQVGIARLNTDGSVDTAFAPVLAPDKNYPPLEVTGFAVQPDGKIVITGEFSAINGVAANCLARLNADGSLDQTFNPPQGLETAILALQPDGKILVGGNRSTFAGLLRLNADGSKDATFTSTSSASSVECIALQADGRILIGGLLGNSGIVRLNADGSTDAIFNPGTDDADILALAVQSDGKILAGGNFSSFGGMPTTDLTRLNGGEGGPGALQFTTANYTVNENGTATISVSRITGGAGAVSVNCAASDGTAVAGTDYTATSATLSWADGDTSLKAFTVPILDPVIPDGSAKTFSVSLSAPTGGATLAALATATVAVTRGGPGSVDATFVQSSDANNDGVTVAVIQPDGKILVAGDFDKLDGVFVNGLARLNTDGSVDSSFLGGENVNAFIQSLALQSDGKILVGGFAGIARVNADRSQDATFNVGAGPNRDVLVPVAKVALQSDGKIIIGGQLTAFNGTARTGIARLNTDGSLDSAFDPVLTFVGNDPSPEVLELVVQPDDKIIIGGEFTTVNGVAASDLARLNADGSLDQTFNPPQGLYGLPLALQPDGKIVVGGYLRLNADGSKDTSFVSSSSYECVALQPDGKILGGGEGGVVRLNADGSVDDGFNPGTGPAGMGVNGGSSAIIYSLAVQNDGKIVVTGNFGSFDGTLCTDITRLNGGDGIPAPPAGSPTVTAMIAGSGMAVEGGAAGKILVKRTGATSTALTVHYKVQGSAKAGVDYKPLAGTVTIPAGAAQAKIKVKPLDDEAVAGTRVAKIRLLPATDDSYQLGSATVVKIKVLADK